MYKSWNRQLKLIGYVNILGEKRVKNIEIFILSKLKKKNNPFVLGQIIDNYKNKQLLDLVKSGKKSFKPITLGQIIDNNKNKH